MTTYIVFSNTDAGGPRWQVVAHYEARSANSAIRLHLDETMADETHNGEYAAVPARSWKPVTVAVETKQMLRFS